MEDPHTLQSGHANRLQLKNIESGDSTYYASLKDLHQYLSVDLGLGVSFYAVRASANRGDIIDGKYEVYRLGKGRPSMMSKQPIPKKRLRFRRKGAAKQLGQNAPEAEPKLPVDKDIEPSESQKKDIEKMVQLDSLEKGAQTKEEFKGLTTEHIHSKDQKAKRRKQFPRVRGTNEIAPYRVRDSASAKKPTLDESISRLAQLMSGYTKGLEFKDEEGDFVMQGDTEAEEKDETKEEEGEEKMDESMEGGGVDKGEGGGSALADSSVVDPLPLFPQEKDAVGVIEEDNFDELVSQFDVDKARQTESVEAVAGEQDSSGINTESGGDVSEDATTGDTLEGSGLVNETDAGDPVEMNNVALGFETNVLQPFRGRTTNDLILNPNQSRKRAKAAIYNAFRRPTRLDNPGTSNVGATAAQNPTRKNVYSRTVNGLPMAQGYVNNETVETRFGRRFIFEHERPNYDGDILSRGSVRVGGIAGRVNNYRVKQPRYLPAFNIPVSDANVTSMPMRVKSERPNIAGSSASHEFKDDTEAKNIAVEIQSKKERALTGSDASAVRNMLVNAMDDGGARPIPSDSPQENIEEEVDTMRDNMAKEGIAMHAVDKTGASDINQKATYSRAINILKRLNMKVSESSTFVVDAILDGTVGSQRLLKLMESTSDEKKRKSIRSMVSRITNSMMLRRGIGPKDFNEAEILQVNQFLNAFNNELAQMGAASVPIQERAVPMEVEPAPRKPEKASSSVPVAAPTQQAIPMEVDPAPREPMKVPVLPTTRAPDIKPTTRLRKIRQEIQDWTRLLKNKELKASERVGIRKELKELRQKYKKEEATLKKMSESTTSDEPSTDMDLTGLFEEQGDFVPPPPLDSPTEASVPEEGSTPVTPPEGESEPAVPTQPSKELLEDFFKYVTENLDNAEEYGKIIQHIQSLGRKELEADEVNRLYTFITNKPNINKDLGDMVVDATKAYIKNVMDILKAEASGDDKQRDELLKDLSMYSSGIDLALTEIEEAEQATPTSIEEAANTPLPDDPMLEAEEAEEASAPTESKKTVELTDEDKRKLDELLSPRHEVTRLRSKMKSTEKKIDNSDSYSETRRLKDNLTKLKLQLKYVQDRIDREKMEKRESRMDK